MLPPVLRCVPVTVAPGKAITTPPLSTVLPLATPAENTNW